jgi:hypothetical protein
MRINQLVYGWLFLLVATTYTVIARRKTTDEPVWQISNSSLKRVYSPLSMPLVKHATLKSELSKGQEDYDAYEKKIMAHLANSSHHPVIFIPTFGGSSLKNISDGPATCNSSNVLFLGKKSNERGNQQSHKSVLSYKKASKREAAVDTLSSSNLVNVTYNESKDSSEPASNSIGTMEDGDICGVQVIHSSDNQYGFYLEYLMEKLVKYLNYTPNYDLLAFSYDYRFVIDEPSLRVQYARLKATIESVYDVTQQPVHMIAHGMGSIYALAFLNHAVDQDWKDKFIYSFIAISTPFKGSSRALNVLIEGEKLHVDGFTSTYSHKMDNNSALLWMLPRPLDFDKEFEASQGLFADSLKILTLNDIIPFFPSVSDINALLELAGEQKDYIDIYMNQIERLWKLALPQYPNVSITCIYGRGIATPSSYNYSMNSLSTRGSPTAVTATDGDGVATVDSLGVCNQWIEPALEQKRYLQIYELDGEFELFDTLAYRALPLL